MKDYFEYVGKDVVVTGAASGMGNATAKLLVELGANVYALDVKEVEIAGIKQFIQVDLSEKDSIDQAFSQIPEKIDAFFGVAGLLGAALDFMYVAKVNLIANKYILEDILIDRMKENGAIAIVTSAVATNWALEGNTKYYKSVLDAKGYDNTVAALEATGLTKINQGFAYIYTKLAMTYMIAKFQSIYGPKHIRVNALLPGETYTYFGSEGNNGQAISKEGDQLSDYAGYSDRQADAMEMAKPLAFLNSPLASYISGAILHADYGTSIEVLAGIRNSPVGNSIDDTFQQK